MSSSGKGASGKILKIDAVGLTLTAVLAGAAYFLGVEPVFSARAQVEEKRRLIEEQSRNAGDAEQLVQRERDRMNDLAKRLKETAVPLQPRSKLNERLVVISQLVEKHGMAVQSLDPGTATSDPELGKFQMVPIRLSGSGAFTEVAAFIHELAELYKDVEVRVLSLSAPAASPAADPAASEKKPGAEPAPSFVLELRWYAAPAASGALAGDAGAE